MKTSSSFLCVQKYKAINWMLISLFSVGFINAQESANTNFDSFVYQAVELSEKALYDAHFDDALRYLQLSYFEPFSEYNYQHEILLTIKNIRIQSFRARLRQIPFSTTDHLKTLQTLLPKAKKIKEKNIEGLFYTTLSFFFISQNLDSCLFYENKALEIFRDTKNYKALAELRATRISRILDIYFQEDKKEEALALIPEFRKEIEFASKHSPYALSYNTRHLANIYRRYDVDQQEALSLYKQSLALRQEIGFMPFITASYYSIGATYVKLKKNEEAIEAYLKSIEFAEKVNFIRYTIQPLVRIGDIYSNMGDSAKAKEFYIKALKAASNGNYPERGIEEILEQLQALK